MTSPSVVAEVRPWPTERPLLAVSAVVAALSVCGLPFDGFRFVGFAPRTGSKRKAWLASIAGDRAASVFFESPARLATTLAELAACLPAERAVAGDIGTGTLVGGASMSSARAAAKTSAMLGDGASDERGMRNTGRTPKRDAVSERSLSLRTISGAPRRPAMPYPLTAREGMLPHSLDAQNFRFGTLVR